MEEKGGRKERYKSGWRAMAYIAIGPAPSSRWGNGHMIVAQRLGGKMFHCPKTIEKKGKDKEK